ncbi:MAG: TonB-dependent receptor [Acidobacteria bacterium]|nr:TonB-dependent receptor [Acidobacteriota bacterium]
MAHPTVYRLRLYTPLLLSALLLALEQPVSAQTAQLTGRVTDASGAVIQGASLTVTNVDTTVSKQTISNQEGIYTVPFLPPGNYMITVQMIGFKPVRKPDFRLSVDQVAREDFALEVGMVVEAVTVESTSPLLERETASVSQVIDNKTIVTLPLNGRNYSQLAVLMPGAIPDQVGAFFSDGFNLNGNRALYNSFLIDGLDNNNHLLAIKTGSTQALRPSIDAIQEFRVESANYSAEYGRAAGGVISVVIKSGTNKFHGSAFEFLRNDKLDANDFFSNRAGLDRAPLRFNQFGGTLGGPVLPNRLFFFASYQATRDHRAKTETTTVPTPDMVRGHFGNVTIYDPLNVVGGVRLPFPNNRIPENRMDPVGRRLAALYPAPNQPGTVNNFVASQSRTDDAGQFDLRVDHHLRASDTLFVRYSNLDRDTSLASLFAAPGNGLSAGGSAAGGLSPALKAFNAYSFVAGETHIFSVALANEFRIGYTKNESNERNPAAKSLYGEFGIKGVPPFDALTGLPNINMMGNFANLGDDTFLPDRRRSRVLQINDNLSWVRGTHAMKYGVEMRLRNNFGHIMGGARGIFNFNGQFTSQLQAAQIGGSAALADLLLGQTSSANLSTQLLGDFHDRYWGFYGSDIWRLTRKFTLNLGLRYELQTPLWETNNRMANFDLDRASPTFGTLVLATNGNIRSRTFSNMDTNNFAPRIGFAYLVDARTVVRAAFGVFYGGRGFENVPGTGAFNPPFNVNIPIRSGSGAATSSLVLADGFPEGLLDPQNARNPNLYAQASDFPFPEVYQWNLGVQREFTGDLLVSLAYVGSGSGNLNGFIDPNQPPPGPGAINPRRPFPAFGSISFQSSFAHATYHSLQAKVERRFTRGFSLLSSYTWSHVIDNAVALGDQGPGGSFYSQEPNNTRAEKSSASFDIQQRFVTSVIYELPIGRAGSILGDSSIGRAILGGWQLGGIFVAQGGTPMTPFVDAERHGLANPVFGGSPFRPDRVRDGILSGDERSVDRWFDVGAFPLSARYIFGNSGRNVLRAPGFINLDFLVARDFRITESTRLELRGEFFNFTNSVHLGRPNLRISTPQVAGRITTTASPNRQVQIGLRLVF